MQGDNVGYFAGRGGSSSMPAHLPPLPGAPPGRLPSVQQGYQGTPGSVAASQALATYPVQWSPSGPPPAGMPLPPSGSQPSPQSPYAGGGVYH
jgi:hypothetical protein